jgi:hypothetical protein
MEVPEALGAVNPANPHEAGRSGSGGSVRKTGFPPEFILS